MKLSINQRINICTVSSVNPINKSLRDKLTKAFGKTATRFNNLSTRIGVSVLPSGLDINLVTGFMGPGDQPVQF